MAFQVSPTWSGTLQIQARILNSTGKIGYDSVGVAYSYANAYIDLQGNDDNGCQSPAVTGTSG